MANLVELSASPRDTKGTSAARRLRRDDQVPGIVYGGQKPPLSVQFSHNELIKMTASEAFFSQIVKLNINGKSQQVVLRDIQQHPYKPKILHLDFQRVSKKEKLQMTVPLHFIAEEDAPGVKEEGGVVSHLLSEITIRCLPADLPEFIEVDVSKLALNEVIRLSELKLPDDVEIPELALGEEHDQAVVNIHPPRVEAPPEEEALKTEEEAKAEEVKTEEPEASKKGGESKPPKGSTEEK